jgi:small subunit ribosomal protein S9
MTLNGLETEIKNYNASDLLFQTIGKRKCAIANLSGYRGQGNIFINNIPVDQYVQFNNEFLNKILEPLNLLEIGNEYDLIIKTNGGGIKGQTDAAQLAIAKAFASLSPENRSVLKKKGLLTRDSRIKERRKYGLKKARKASQFSKR